MASDLNNVFSVVDIEEEGTRSSFKGRCIRCGRFGHKSVGCMASPDEIPLDWFPGRCSKCGRIGHKVSGCMASPEEIKADRKARKERARSKAAECAQHSSQAPKPSKSRSRRRKEGKGVETVADEVPAVNGEGSNRATEGVHWFPGRCIKCGRIGHMSYDCMTSPDEIPLDWFPGRCIKCGRLGHKSSGCMASPEEIKAYRKVRRQVSPSKAAEFAQRSSQAPKPVADKVPVVNRDGSNRATEGIDWFPGQCIKCGRFGHKSVGCMASPEEIKAYRKVRMERARSNAAECAQHSSEAPKPVADEVPAVNRESSNRETEGIDWFPGECTKCGRIGHKLSGCMASPEEIKAYRKVRKERARSKAAECAQHSSEAPKPSKSRSRRRKEGKGVETVADEVPAVNGEGSNRATEGLDGILEADMKEEMAKPALDMGLKTNENAQGGVAVAEKPDGPGLPRRLKAALQLMKTNDPNGDFVDLSKCNVLDEHISLICDALKNNTEVLDLDLSKNRISKAGLSDLSACLQQGAAPSLLRLDLRGNKAGSAILCRQDEGVEAQIMGLQQKRNEVVVLVDTQGDFDKTREPNHRFPTKQKMTISQSLLDLAFDNVDKSDLAYDVARAMTGTEDQATEELARLVPTMGEMLLQEIRNGDERVKHLIELMKPLREEDIVELLTKVLGLSREPAPSMQRPFRAASGPGTVQANDAATKLSELSSDTVERLANAFANSVFEIGPEHFTSKAMSSVADIKGWISADANRAALVDEFEDMVKVEVDALGMDSRTFLNEFGPTLFSRAQEIMRHKQEELKIKRTLRQRGKLVRPENSISDEVQAEDKSDVLAMSNSPEYDSDSSLEIIDLTDPADAGP